MRFPFIASVPVWFGWFGFLASTTAQTVAPFEGRLKQEADRRVILRWDSRQALVDTLQVSGDPATWQTTNHQPPTGIGQGGGVRGGPHLQRDLSEKIRHCLHKMHADGPPVVLLPIPTHRGGGRMSHFEGGGPGGFWGLGSRRIHLFVQRMEATAAAAGLIGPAGDVTAPKVLYTTRGSALSLRVHLRPPCPMASRGKS